MDIPIPGHTPGDTRVVPETLDGTRQSLAAVGVVRETGLRLSAALIQQTGLIDETRIDAVAAVLGDEFVFGVDGVGAREQEGCREQTDGTSAGEACEGRGRWLLLLDVVVVKELGGEARVGRESRLPPMGYNYCRSAVAPSVVAGRRRYCKGSYCGV